MSSLQILLQKKLLLKSLVIFALLLLGSLKFADTTKALECWQAAESCTPGGVYSDYDCSPYGEYCRNYNTRYYNQCGAKSGEGSGCTGDSKHLYAVEAHDFNCTFSCTFTGYKCDDRGKVCGQCDVPASAPACPTTCHTDTQYPSNDCGTSTCDPNQPSAEDCPTTCHTDTKYVYDGKTCTKDKKCDPNAPARQSDPACSTTDLTLRNGDCTTRTFYANCSSSTSLCYDNGSSVRCCLKAGTVPSCRTSDGSVPNGQCDNTSYTANCDSSTSLCYDNGSSVRCCLQGGTCSTACGVTSSYTVPNGQCGNTTCSATSPCAVSSAPTVTSSCPSGVNPQMVISWIAAAGADTYELWRSDNGGPSILISNTIAGTSTTFTDNATNDPLYTPISGVSYRYTLRSWNNTTGYSAYSPWSTAVVAAACDIRAPENITDPNSFNLLVGLNNKCFDKSGSDGKDWDSLGGVQSWASDNIGVTSLNFIVTRNEGGTIPPFPAEENLGPPTTVTNEPSLIDGVQVRRSQWKKIISFADLGVGTYSIVAVARDAAGNEATSSTVNFRLADLCVRPWIQTTGGDVHSNTRIYTPGGP